MTTDLMVGHGFYNRHSPQQLLVARAAMDLWRRAVAARVGEPRASSGHLMNSLVIADYGSSQGANLGRAVDRGHRPGPEP